MTIKTEKNKKIEIRLGVGIILGIILSVLLTYLTLFLATATGDASKDMITMVYGASTLCIGLISLIAYIGTATMIAIQLFQIIEPTLENK